MGWTVTDEGAPPLRVLFVNLGRGLGGSSRALLSALERLPGIERWVFAPPSQLVEVGRRRGLIERWVEMPWRRERRGLARIASARQLSRLLATDPVDVVHANGFSELNLAMLAVRRHDVPVLLWSHAGRANPTAGVLARFWSDPRRRLHAAAVSDTAAEVVATTLGLEDERIERIGNPIDRDAVVATDRVPAPDDRLRVLFLGQGLEVKGFDLLPAVVDAAGARCSFRLHTTRPDPAASPAAATAYAQLEELSGDGRVELRGRIPDIREAFAQADVLLVPSRTESFSRVAVEAMANGLPVVASDLPALRALLTDPPAGLVHPVGDVEAIVAALHTLADGERRREELGAAGRRIARRFDAEEPARLLAARYRELVGQS